MFDAVCDVIPEDFFLKSPQSGANRGDLGDHVNAVAVLFHHAGEAPDLPLDAAEPL